MAKAKQKLDFTIDQKDVVVPVSKIRHEFDVRAELSTDTEAIQELVEEARQRSGKLRRNPILTADFVEVDGRNGIKAQQILYGTDKDPDGLSPDVTVDLLGFKWSDLNADQKRELVAYALGLNMSPTGFRRLATFDDKLSVIKKFVTDGVSKDGIEELVGNLPGMTMKAFQSMYADAVASVNNTKLGKARQAMVPISKGGEGLTVEEAIKAYKVPKHLHDSVIPGAPRPKKAFNALKEKQPMLNSALLALKRYMDANLVDFDNGKLSVKTLDDITSFHRLTILKIVRKMEEIETRVKKAIENSDNDPTSFHRS
jgi:hypothetical protein